MPDTIPISPRVERYGCGIYEVASEKCYVTLFVTDTGFVLPLKGHILSGEDLMEVYVQGRMDERELADGDGLLVAEADNWCPGYPENTY